MSRTCLPSSRSVMVGFVQFRKLYFLVGELKLAFTIREKAPYMLAFFLLQVCYNISMDLSMKPDQLISSLYVVEMFRGQLTFLLVVKLLCEHLKLF